MLPFSHTHKKAIWKTILIQRFSLFQRHFWLKLDFLFSFSLFWHTGLFLASLMTFLYALYSSILLKHMITVALSARCLQPPFAYQWWENFHVLLMLHCICGPHDSSRGRARKRWASVVCWPRLLQWGHYQLPVKGKHRQSCFKQLWKCQQLCQDNNYCY